MCIVIKQYFWKKSVGKLRLQPRFARKLILFPITQKTKFFVMTNDTFQVWSIDLNYIIIKIFSLKSKASKSFKCGALI